MVLFKYNIIISKGYIFAQYSTRSSTHSIQTHSPVAEQQCVVVCLPSTSQTTNLLFCYYEGYKNVISKQNEILLKKKLLEMSLKTETDEHFNSSGVLEL